METSVAPPNIRERFKKATYPERAPWEHMVIGSTPVVKGNVFNMREAVDQAKAGSEDALRQIRTPIFIQSEEEQGKSLVLAERAKRKMEKMGASIIDPFFQVALMNQGMQVVVELPDIDIHTLQTAMTTKVYIASLDDPAQVINNEDLLRRLQLVEVQQAKLHPYQVSPQEILAVEFVPGQDFATLSLHI